MRYRQFACSLGVVGIPGSKRCISRYRVNRVLVKATHSHRRFVRLLHLRASCRHLSLVSEREALDDEPELGEHALAGSARLLGHGPRHGVGAVGKAALPHQRGCEPHPAVPRHERITDSLSDIAPFFGRELGCDRLACDMCCDGQVATRCRTAATYHPPPARARLLRSRYVVATSGCSTRRTAGGQT